MTRQAKHEASRCLNAALAYAERGWRVFPLDGKRPFPGTHGHKDATTDAHVIRKLWAKYPDANVGIACDSERGPLVLDVDGPQGEAALAGIVLPATLRVQSRTGRYHLYYDPCGKRVRRAIGVLDHVDVLGDGGYVVAAPSVHPDTGEPYQVVDDLPLAPFPIARFPSANGKGQIRNDQAAIEEGRRNSTLTELAGVLRRRALSYEAIHDALSAINTVECLPPLTDTEVAQIARSIADKPAPDQPPLPSETFALLEELLNDPELLREPAYVVAHLAYRERTTLLAGLDKSGKSTLARHAAAAVATGNDFLGWPTDMGNVLWIGLEETLADAVREFNRLRADPSRVRLLRINPGGSLLTVVDEMLREWPCALMVIDSVAEYARTLLGQAPDNGDAAGWGRVVRPVVELARRHGVAVLLIHHMRKSGDEYRGSTEIAAAVDCLWEMKAGNKDEDPTLRRFTGRARWPVQDWSVRLNIEANSFEVNEGGVQPLEARIENDVKQHPGTTQRGVRERVSGNAAAIIRTIKQLLESGTIHKRDDGRLYPGPERGGDDF